LIIRSLDPLIFCLTLLTCRIVTLLSNINRVTMYTAKGCLLLGEQANNSDSLPAMAKEQKISSNRSTPEPTLSKVLGQSSASSLVSESVTEPDEGQDSSSSAVCSSAVSRHTNEHRPNNEHDQCRKVPILHHIIVERLEFFYEIIKLSLGDKKKTYLFPPLRYEGDKCGEMFHGEGVAYFQGGHVYKVSGER